MKEYPKGKYNTVKATIDTDCDIIENVFIYEDNKVVYMLE